GGGRDGPLFFSPLAAATTLTLIAAHHDARTFFMGLDADRQVTDHVLVDAALTLKLGDDFARAFDVEQHEVRLAVAVNLVGEVLEAPGLGLGDLALAILDDFGGGGGEGIVLSLAQVLPRQKYMLVQRHARVPFIPCRSLADPAGAGAPPA